MTEEPKAALKPPGRPPKKEAGAVCLKDQIMDSAMMVFSAQGLSGASLKEISRKAEVTPALIHYYFGDRRGLLEEALANRFMPLAFSFLAAVETSDDPLEVLREIGRRLIEAALSIPWFVPLWSRELASEGGRLRAYIRPRLERAALNKFTAMIRRGQDDGLINRNLTPELVFLSLSASILLPLSAREDWGLIYDTEITIDQAVRHVTVMFQGILINNP